MSEQPMQTIAVCDHCGRGYCWISDRAKAYPCMAKCGGTIRLLAEPEGMDDDYNARQRRLNAIARDIGYLLDTAAPPVLGDGREQEEKEHEDFTRGRTQADSRSRELPRDYPTK